jgi:hypothetical protein
LKIPETENVLFIKYEEDAPPQLMCGTEQKNDSNALFRFFFPQSSLHHELQFLSDIKNYMTQVLARLEHLSENTDRNVMVQEMEIWTPIIAKLVHEVFLYV